MSSKGSVGSGGPSESEEPEEVDEEEAGDDGQSQQSSGYIGLRVGDVVDLSVQASEELPASRRIRPGEWVFYNTTHYDEYKPNWVWALVGDVDKCSAGVECKVYYQQKKL
jgi:hypothetical protein